MSSQNNPSSDWWTTKIIEMQPGVIRYHGYAIEDLIGRVSFPAMIWLMTRGELPSEAEAALLGTALMSAVDHGPQAPSIAIARITATCGVGINNAMASGANALGDVHGGAGEQCAVIYTNIARLQAEGTPLEAAAQTVLAAFFASGRKFVPGFGHRFHKPVDPRAPRLMEVLRAAEAAGSVPPGMAAIAEAVEAAILTLKGRAIPMNIDGATAAIYTALGFPAPLCRGLFVLSRSVGIMAHAWEQMQEPARNKGPIPRDLIWTYAGTPARPLPDDLKV